MDHSRKGEILSFLALMRMKACGKYEPLWPSPKREVLQCFGGKLSIEEFRNYGGGVEPPIVHWPFEHKYTPTIGFEIAPLIKSSPAGKMKAIEDSTLTVDSLKLKREKPLARSSSKLESALGITRKTK